MAIAAKQLRLETDGGLQKDASNGGLEVKFDTTSVQTIDSSSDGIKIATTAAGNGLTGGGTSALAVQPNTTDGNNEPGLETAANGVRISTGAAGNGLTGGGGDALAVDPNNTDDGGVSGLETAANGVRIATTAAGTGLTGGGGSALAIDTASTIDFAGCAWTFTPDELQISGTPDSANDAVNKAYVDGLSMGLTWKDPVDVMQLVGQEGAATIEGLSPTVGDAYVVDDVSAGEAPAGDLVGAAVGDIWEYDGTNWQKIITGSGGFVPNGTRAALSTQTALIGNWTDATDDGKLTEFDGTDLGPGTLYTSQDDDAVYCQGEGSVYEGGQWVFDGSVATGEWKQFGGASPTNAGAGLTASGNVFNVGDAGRGVQVNSGSLEIDGSEMVHSTGGLDESANSWQLKIKTHAGNEGAAVSTDASGVNIDGDIIHIDYAESNYTPATTGTGADVDDLAAHLEGIDNKLAEVSTMATGNKNQTSGATTGNYQDTTLDIAATPTGHVAVYVNKIGPYVLGDGSRDSCDCYFSADAGATARSISAIVATDSLYWNGGNQGIAQFDLDANDVIDMIYDS
jgi:hypothetical protein